MIFHGFFQGKPIPQGSKTAMVVNGRAVMFEANKNHKVYRAGLEKWFGDNKPTLNPVRVELVFYFTRPKSVKRDYPSVKPDIDKLCRTVLDAATGRLFKDDSQVVILNARKEYTPHVAAEGVLIRCFEIDSVTIR
jgi:Holliday junction resolvase RusA-like endonuclease